MKHTFNSTSGIYGYHIHVYFDPAKGNEDTARAIVENVPLENDARKIHKIGVVGPHLMPNFALHISPDNFGKAVAWLQMNAKDVSILVHPETGDEFEDHLARAMWIGKPVPLSQDFFARYLKSQNPLLRDSFFSVEDISRQLDGTHGLAKRLPVAKP